MTTLAICGVKGGCGATALTAALAWRREELGRPVLAMDLCEQNLLRLHFGMPWRETDGWRARQLAGDDWTAAAWRAGDNLTLVPHGLADEAGAALPANWLRDELACLDRPEREPVLLDTPSASSTGRELALAAASHVLAVLPAEPASCALVDSLREELDRRGIPDRRVWFALNQFDPARRLDRDVELLLRKRLGDRLAPLPVMRDEAMREAFAAGRPLAVYAPESQAADDIRQLALWLTVRLQDGKEAAA